MRLTRAIEDYLADCRRDKKTAGTLKTYGNSLGFLARLAMLRKRDEVGAFTPALVQEYFDLADERGNSLETLIRKKVALQGFAKWGTRKRLWTVPDPMAEAPRYRKPEKLPRPLDREDGERLMEMALDPSERALRAVLYYSGLRSAEILALRIGDVVFGDGARPGRLVVLHGKGNRQRAVPMMPELEAELGDFLMDRADPRRFVFAKRSGAPWTYTMLRYRATRWGKQAGVTKLVAHRLRHTAATEMVEAGADIEAVQKALGHKSPATTMHYVRVADRKVEDAMLLRSKMLARRAGRE